MHRYLFILIIFMLAIPLSGQTAQEIIQRHELVTGMAARQKVRTLASIGTITQMGNTVPISIIQKRPNKYRFDVHLSEGRITQAFDGNSGWTQNPYISTDTLPLDGPALAQIRESAEFDGILHSYRAKGYTVNYDGITLVGPQKAHKVRLKKPNGETMIFYFDTVTFFVIKTEAELLVNGLPYQAESVFGDFRRVSGMTLPYFIQSKNGALVTEIRIDTVRINENMEDQYFIWRNKQ